MPYSYGFSAAPLFWWSTVSGNYFNNNKKFLYLILHYLVSLKIHDEIGLFFCKVRMLKKF